MPKERLPSDETTADPNSRPRNEQETISVPRTYFCSNVLLYVCESVKHRNSLKKSVSIKNCQIIGLFWGLLFPKYLFYFGCSRGQPWNTFNFFNLSELCFCRIIKPICYFYVLSKSGFQLDAVRYHQSISHFL